MDSVPGCLRIVLKSLVDKKWEGGLATGKPA